MNWTIIFNGLQALSILAACLVALGTLRGRSNDSEARLVGMQKDIEYIKEQVSGYSAMRDRLTKLEASCKSAHNRIDELIGKRRKEE